MKMTLRLAVTFLSLGFATMQCAFPDEPAPDAAANAPQPIFTKYSDTKWDKILPDLGKDSPEICILRVDPKTKSAALMIRIPTAIHVRKHWHSANETHTVLIGNQVFGLDDKKVELAPGGFNFIPSKKVHEAWLPAGSLVFITTDGPWDITWVDGAPTAADLMK